MIGSGHSYSLAIYDWHDICDRRLEDTPTSKEPMWGLDGFFQEEKTDFIPLKGFENIASGDLTGGPSWN